MSRVQLALNVKSVDEAVGFYERLFGVGPAKRREGYANFVVSDPPLKLVLIEGEEGGTLNHLGVEVESADDVAEASVRLAGEGLATEVQDDVTCCYARQDKVWVADPDGAPWEVYVVHEDADVMRPAESQCCEPTTVASGCC
jgi:catechol 2,3-dioxygenase-like lactoylglutathione lyase family enzyme